MTHSLGPWTFERNDEWHIRDAQDNSLQCNEADWHLIAAAPELLESLKEMLSYCIWDTEYADRAKAAIAKAEGKP
jgi:hypothetical protein